MSAIAVGREPTKLFPAMLSTLRLDNDPNSLGKKLLIGCEKIKLFSRWSSCNVGIKKQAFEFEVLRASPSNLISKICFWLKIKKHIFMVEVLSASPIRKCRRIIQKSCL
jgi:hypothetical protein